MKTENRHKCFTIQFFMVTIFLITTVTGASKGLKYFTVTMGSDRNAGTSDDVSLALYRGVNGESCKTGVLWQGGLHYSWNKADVETYKASNQDWGNCVSFEADRSSIGFSISKSGENGLQLVKMEFHIGEETYVWMGDAWWDPTHEVLTASCTGGDCLPVDCTASAWTACTDCSSNCTCTSTRKIIQDENDKGKCPEREELEKLVLCKDNKSCSHIQGREGRDYKGSSLDTASQASGAGGAVAAVTVILLLVAVVFLVFRKWRAKNKDDGAYVEDFRISFREDEPVNLAVTKDANIRINVKKLADNKAALKQEFKRIEKYAEEVIKLNSTVDVANKMENKEHNRYVDQVPYDLNMVKLQTPVGDPPGTYINASTITFPTMDQTFIAVQAPKENSFPAFWQLVLENQVTTIVMITGLVEGGKEKANQYWPDMKNKNMDLGDINIRYENHSYPGTYYHRNLVVRDGQGRERAVNHIQTTAWLDMKAPKDTKVLLDLVYKAQELAQERRGPMVIHCSAGVGRTGTLIGLYKLVHDYHNNKVKELDLFSTVVEMREQRMKMVQKSAQYVYIAKCLQDYITAQTDEYYG